MLQSAVDLLKEELEQAKAENVTLQQDKELLVNMVSDRDEEIKQLTVVPDYKVEGSWATYNLKGYGPVRLSLN